MPRRKFASGTQTVYPEWMRPRGGYSQARLKGPERAATELAGSNPGTRLPWSLAAQIAIWTVALSGCGGNEPTAPPAPGGGGRGTALMWIRAGTAAARPDGGTPDGGNPPDTRPSPMIPETECFRLPEGASPIVFPADFVPTHVAATWQSDCRTPTVWVALSDDGCPDGRGHELSFFLEVGALDDGRLFLGDNPLPISLAGGLGIRYQRAGPIEPVGTWGNCDNANGVLELDRFDPETAGDVAIDFELLLTDCSGAGAPSMMVSGGLEVYLARGRRAACGP